MSLRQKLVLFSILMIGLIGIISISTVYWGSGVYLKQVFFRGYTEGIERVLGDTNKFFLDRRADLSLQADRISGFSKSEREQVERNLVGLRNAMRSYLSLAVFLPSGEKIIDTNRLGIGEISQSGYLKQALKSEEAILDYDNHPDTNIPCFVFAKSIRHENEVIGVVVGYSAVSNVMGDIDEVFISDRESSRTDIKVIQADIETILYANSDATIDYDRHKMATIEDIGVGQNRKGTVLVQETNDDFIFLGEGDSFASKYTGKWHLLVRKSKADLFAPLYRMTFIISLLFALLLAGAGWGLYWVYARLFSPIAEISERLTRFGRGEFEVFQEIPQGNDEISVMVRNLNSMSQDLKMSMAELGQQSRLSAIGQMAGGIAHEINNPLSIIMLRADILAQMISKGKLDAREIKDGLDKITETVTRISKIIKGLRALARDGKSEAASEVYVTTVIESTLELCQQSAKNKDIRVETKINSQTMRFECRPVQISQVLLNLMNNAFDEIKNLPFADRWVEIRAEETEDRIILQVVNGGPKISDEIVGKLFQTFFTTKSSGQGTGLGLSISKQIVNSHSGKIYVDVKAANTCMVIDLPKLQPVFSSRESSSGKSAA